MKMDDFAGDKLNIPKIIHVKYAHYLQERKTTRSVMGGFCN